MKRCFDTLTESKVKTKAEILREIPYSQRDIETLMNLPEGYFDDDFGRLRHFPTVKPTLAPNGAVVDRVGNLITFEPKKP